MFVSNWLGPPGAARRERRARAAILEKLAVLVEDGVRAEVGLEDVGPCHRDLEELGMKVEAALQRDIDRTIERHAVGRSVVFRGQFQTCR